ncbi:unnamed protein product, partial [Ectocarpus sp. 8 AP-2014]
TDGIRLWIYLFLLRICSTHQIILPRLVHQQHQHLCFTTSRAGQTKTGVHTSAPWRPRKLRTGTHRRIPRQAMNDHPLLFGYAQHKRLNDIPRHRLGKRCGAPFL